MSLKQYVEEAQDVMREYGGVVISVRELGLHVEVRGTHSASHTFTLDEIEQCRVNPIVAVLPELFDRAGGLVWRGPTGEGGP